MPREIRIQPAGPIMKLTTPDDVHRIKRQCNGRKNNLNFAIADSY